jgi:hypothetical protein
MPYWKNSLAAKYDEEARQYIIRASKLEEQADNTASIAKQKTLRGQGQRLRQKAISTLEKAKKAADKL